MTTTVRGPAIEVAGLRKSYRSKSGTQLVLDGVDLVVPAGTITALLGPNGSGKTTTVGVLSTLLAADAGTVRVAGHDIAREPDAVRASIGVTGQITAVDELLTGTENLRLMADLNHLGKSAGRRRATALLEQFGLAEAAGKPVATYSGGMKRKLDLAMTLVGTPSVVFLDEPTTGLDPRSRRTLWDEVRALVEGAPRSCSPRSTSRRRTGSPTPSRSSTAVASSPRARPQSSSPCTTRARSTRSSSR